MIAFPDGVAVQVGATSLYAPADRDYGERSVACAMPPTTSGISQLTSKLHQHTPSPLAASCIGIGILIY